MEKSNFLASLGLAGILMSCNSVSQSTNVVQDNNISSRSQVLKYEKSFNPTIELEWHAFKDLDYAWVVMKLESPSRVDATAILDLRGLPEDSRPNKHDIRSMLSRGSAPYKIYLTQDAQFILGRGKYTPNPLFSLDLSKAVISGEKRKNLNRWFDSCVSRELEVTYSSTAEEDEIIRQRPFDLLSEEYRELSFNPSSVGYK